uniref:C2H2-type domain-containing protein n=1 Tax=Pristionchus pacificus TaxID=54126 RepID=A0A8R1UQ91_PRIPA
RTRARARTFGPFIEPVIRRTRYEPIKLHYYVSFITSPIISTGIPYGERKVKASDGSSVSIPNTIRLHRNAEIIRMYKKHMEDIGKKHLIIKDSVAYAILKKCSATRRHALTCVDYFIAEGSDAFEDVEDILSTLQASALLDSDMAKLWKYNVAQSRLYLKTDFRMHLKKESKVIEHCYCHSLSDPHNDAFKYKGPKHSHTVRCPRCIMMESTSKEINNLLGSLKENMDSSNPSWKTVTEMIIRMEQNEERIMQMKMHLVRARYTDLERTRIIAELKNGEAFVTMDYAQKFLAMYKWEDERKYFAKRCMPWHVSHIIAKIKGEYVQHSIAHVLHTNKQDNHSVVQMIDHVLSILREMNITGTHFRAHNAGAYHSLGTVASIPHLAKKNGVAIHSFSFSEAQNGKSSCDRVAAQVKRKLRDFVARGNNIRNAKELFSAISQSGLKGLSRTTVKREKTEKAEKALGKLLRPKMEGISGFGHFVFDKNTIRVWKMNGIGDGRLYTDLSGFTRVLKIEEEGGFLASSESSKADEASIQKGDNPERFWTAYLTKKDSNEEEIDDVDEIDNHGHEMSADTKEAKGLFTCQECCSSFINYGNIIRHMEIGRHRIRPEKIHIYDYALGLFKRNLEDVQAHNNVLSEVSQAMTEMSHGADLSSKAG